MHSSILALHIISFSASLLLFPVLALAAIQKVTFSRTVKVTSISLTTSGFATGVALLIAHPAGTHCLMLAAYLAAFIALYYAAASRQALATEHIRNN